MLRACYYYYSRVKTTENVFGAKFQVQNIFCLLSNTKIVITYIMKFIKKWFLWLYIIYNNYSIRVTNTNM